MLKKAIGIALYSVFKHFPASYKMGGGTAKKLWNFSARLILTKCDKSVNIEKGASFSSKCTIGNNSGIGVNSKLGIVHCGNDVLMGPDCVALTRNHAFMDRSVVIREQGYTEDKPIYIDDDVWIGQRVIILPGVHIARGTVVGAGAVVTKDTVPYSVVGGNPARLLKMRENIPE